MCIGPRYWPHVSPTSRVACHFIGLMFHRHPMSRATLLASRFTDIPCRVPRYWPHVSPTSRVACHFIGLTFHRHPVWRATLLASVSNVTLVRFTPWFLCELRRYGQEIDRYDWKLSLQLMSISFVRNLVHRRWECANKSCYEVVRCLFTFNGGKVYFNSRKSLLVAASSYE